MKQEANRRCTPGSDVADRESSVTERIDEEGNRWYKAYCGGGAHFRNWLAQCREIGEVMVEEIDPAGYPCFEDSGEKLYRIWVKRRRGDGTPR